MDQMRTCLFFEGLNSKLVSLSNTSILIGGDLNVVQDFSFDTYNYLHKNNLKYHDTILEISSYLDLINVFRNMHTEERRFTWHCPNCRIRVITQFPNSEQSYKGKAKSLK
jgi:exonuclease III